MFVMVIVGIGLTLPQFGPSPTGEQKVVKKVLLVGVDGVRPDAIEASQAKTLKILIENGAFSDRCDVLGDRETKADTASGPGWGTVLTGVWSDKHNILGNDFRGHKLEKFPSMFHRIGATRPDLKTRALVSWLPMHEHILGKAVGSELIVDGDKKGYLDGDRLVADAAVELLKVGAPDLLFIYFGHPDSAGHGYGFHPKSPKYTNAIEEVDRNLTRVLDAIKARKTRLQEDWLVIVCTDHGGKERGHGGGAKVPEIRTGFLIVSGPAAAPGKPDKPTELADVVPTVLTHLGIAIDPKWELDGKPFGLK